MVPVVDVERKRNDFDVGNRLLAEEPGQERISRRAARASLRREELDQNRRFRRRLARECQPAGVSMNGTERS